MAATVGTVIVATNGSSASRRAVRRARTLFPGSEVVVAMVVRDGPTVPVTNDVAAVRAATHHLALDTAAEELEGACRALGSRARALVLMGEPVSALIELARAERADAIVVGSLGPGALGSVLGGSVGADLQRDAPCSVLELGTPDH